MKDLEAGKRITRPNTEQEWITKGAPGLRIIEDVLWYRVQAIKQRNSSRRGNKRQSKRCPFSGLLKCGRCEVTIVGALAQILVFTQKKAAAASPGDDGTFLMVAGARNHLDLQLKNLVTIRLPADT